MLKEINDKLIWCGVFDPDTHLSDVIVPMEFGTTYDAYILKGSEKTAFVENAKRKFKDGYLEGLPDICPDYLIVDHTEPDHSGTLKELLARYPMATVVCSPTAAGFLKEQLNSDFRCMTVGDGDTLSLGDLNLEFFTVPNLHWPDTMFTYVKEMKALFTCDVFGAHYCPPGDDPLRSALRGQDEENYKRTMVDYFNIIIGPYKLPFMAEALEKIKDLDIQLICPGHGPVLDEKIDWLMGCYHEWCTPPAPNDKKQVVIPYVNAYGFTGKLAEKIAEGIRDAADADVSVIDVTGMEDTSGVIAQINGADGVAFGTPTILGDALKPIWDLTTSLFPPLMQGKVATAFGCYGWSGEGVPNIEQRLKQLRMKVIPGLRVRFDPSDSELIDAYDLGYKFGLELIKPEKKAPAATGATMMKCAVCGAVFDASVETCPVCGVGPDKFIPVVTEEVTYSNDTDNAYVIIGGGPAAYSAAKAIRERDKTGTVTVVSNEDYLPYNRPMLTKELLSDVSGDAFAIEGAAWYEENGISFKGGTEVTDIDTTAKKIITSAGDIPYDKLIYATGAFCFVPPIKGSDQAHVKTVRNIKDALDIKALLKDSGSDKVVCIGGGVMGLEGAWELALGGYDVTVLETAPGLLPKQLDDPASAMVEDICNEAGVKIVTGAKITEITADAVLLEDGSSYPASLVVMSTGMRPYTGLAEKAGIAVDKWVVADGQMKTNIDDVYTAGDCMMVYGAPQAFYAQAIECGRIAGANAAGDDLTYDALGASLVINAMNTSIFALGANGKDPSKVYKTVEFKDVQRKTYEKYYFRNSILEGCILIGDTSKMLEMTDHIKNGDTYKDIF